MTHSIFLLGALLIAQSVFAQSSTTSDPVIVIHGHTKSFDEKIVIVQLKNGEIQKFDRKFVRNPIKTNKIEIFASDFNRAQLK